MPRKIKRNSVRSLSPIKPYVKENSSFYLALKLSEVDSARLNDVCGTSSVTEGDYFLPSILGKHTRFNANGREDLDKSGDKETVYRMVNRSWEDWHGNPHSGVSSVPYKRWPRIPIDPPEEHLRIIAIDGELYVATDECIFAMSKDSRNLHVLNVILECFGECEIFNDQGKSLTAPKLSKTNWDLLPKGSFPWSRSKGHIQTVTKSLEPNQQAVIDFRMEHISKRNPDVLAIGRGGFHGYFVFGFSDKGVFVLESIHLDNATYVFGSNWEQLSELTKREIISGGQHIDRIIHSHSWQRKLSTHLR